MKNNTIKHIFFDFTTNKILNIFILIQLEFFIFILFYLISKPISLFLIMSKICFFIFKLLYCNYNWRSNKFIVFISSIYYFSIIYLINGFNTIYMENVDDNNFYEKYKKYILGFSAGFITGFATYFILNKGVDILGDKFIESGKLTKETEQFIRDMQNVPFKCDVFTVSLILGSSVAYIVFKNLS